MGNTQSKSGISQSDSNGNSARESISGEKVGFQVLHLVQNSPTFKAGLVPYFDYIIAVNDVRITSELPNLVVQEAKSSVDKPLKLTIYNSRRDDLRNVELIPTLSWGGDGILGFSIRFSYFDEAIDLVWHVMEVHENSPAMTAGLSPLTDWIIGSPDVVIRNRDNFYDLLIQNKKRPIKLIIYDNKSDTCRIITIVPDLEWGGSGILGCDVASGILHRVPQLASTEFKPVSYEPSSSPNLSVVKEESLVEDPSESLQ